MLQHNGNTVSDCQSKPSREHRPGISLPPPVNKHSITLEELEISNQISELSVFSFVLVNGLNA